MNRKDYRMYIDVKDGVSSLTHDFITYVYRYGYWNHLITASGSCWPKINIPAPYYNSLMLNYLENTLKRQFGSYVTASKFLTKLIFTATRLDLIPTLLKSDFELK